ncbi:MAG: hypothetical protein KatS3mg009_0991 [Acidimicrobiia bacterium]|nr:MAG: hypothetical protein KatS3mg009_0991 [Acidimicrobiia bacterium]
MSRFARLATRPWLVMPLASAVVLAAWWVWRGDAGGGATGDDATGEQVVPATLGTVRETVSASGTVAYAEQEDLSFTASGTVTAVHVAAGQAVTAGTVLAELDSPELHAAVVEAEAAVAEAQATLADDEDAGASSARLAADRSALAAAQDRLADARDALAGTRLVAPFDGTVASVDLTVGEVLGTGGTGGTTTSGSDTGSGALGATIGSADGPSSGSDGTGGTDGSASPHVRLVSAGRYVVEIGLDDLDVDRVEVGRRAQVALSVSPETGLPGGFPGGFVGGLFGGPAGVVVPGGPGGADTGGDATGDASPAPLGVEPADGQVVTVGTVADASSGVATYPVTVAFTDDTGDYHAGAGVLVEIVLAEHTDAVLVPALAVTNEGGEATVTVVAGGRRETRPVETGLAEGMMVEIVSGLTAGESVVVRAPGRVTVGSPPPQETGA